MEKFYPFSGWIAPSDTYRIAEIAEQEAEDRMRKKAAKVFCAANCPKGCSFGADDNIGCGAKARFIQKLSENELAISPRFEIVGWQEIHE